MITKDLFSVCSALIKVSDHDTLYRLIRDTSEKQRDELLSMTNKNNLNLLHLAIIHHNQRVLEIILQLDARGNVPSYRVRGRFFEDVTPLFLAIGHSFHEGVNILIMCNYNIEKVTKCGLSALALASWCGNEYAFDTLLAMNPTIPLALYNSNETTLMMAAYGGNFNIVKKLANYYEECGSQYLFYEKNSFGENVYHYLAASAFDALKLNKSLNLCRHYKIPIIPNNVGVYPTPFASIFGNPKFAIHLAQFTSESMRDIRVLVCIGEHVFKKSKSRKEAIECIRNINDCIQEPVYRLKPYPLLKSILNEQKFVEMNYLSELTFAPFDYEMLAIVVAERLLGHWSFITKHLTYNFAFVSLHARNKRLTRCAYEIIIRSDSYQRNEADITRQLFLEHCLKVQPILNKLEDFDDVVYYMCLRSLIYANDLFEKYQDKWYLEAGLFVFTNSSCIETISDLLNKHIDELLTKCLDSKLVQPLHYIISLVDTINEHDVNIAVLRLLSRKKPLLTQYEKKSLSPSLHALKYNSMLVYETLSRFERNM